MGGARRGADKSWSPALSPSELTARVHDNLAHLGLDVLDVVNLRQSVHAGPDESIAEPFGVLAELRDKGHLRENVAAAGLVLPAGALAELDAIGQAGPPGRAPAS